MKEKRYTVEILSAAERQIKKLPKSAREQVSTAIRSLSKDPARMDARPFKDR